MGEEHHAPGWPGSEPKWTSSAKSGVGTALTLSSNLWFTISHGIFNEIYYPRVDLACTRDMGLVVTGGAGFFSEEKRHASSKVNYISEGVPAFRIINECMEGRYRIEKQILSDPLRECVLQDTVFTPLYGGLEDYHLYVILAPHLGNRGSGNTAIVSDYKGVPMLFAERDELALALASTAPWVKRSVGFVGVSDSWQDLNRNKVMTLEYTRAENGNVALAGEIDLKACRGAFMLVVGLGRNRAEAGSRALASIYDGFNNAKRLYVSGWQAWQSTLAINETLKTSRYHLLRVSTSVLKTHESRHFPGGMIASLSVPWGFIKGDDDLGGYHLVWPRDIVETAGGLLSAGAREDVLRILNYLQVTQESDGHWPQNMWLDGTAYWAGIQMDETAFPVLLVDLARKEKVLEGDSLSRYWPMVRKAAGFILRNGPVTQQDRWEEDPGYSPFTLAAEIAALLVSADLAETFGEKKVAAYIRETADAWNANIERWVYVTGTELAAKTGVEGYYVRIAPPEVSDGASPASGFVTIKNRPVGERAEKAVHIISPDVLSLVRFGLRSPDDPRIVNTVKVLDAILKVDTPSGPAWHRYNGDGYGEHEDGSPFDGIGKGRVWPLLTGERAHYELAAGRADEAEKLLRTMTAFSNDGGMIPEQVWDSSDIPEKELFFGRPSGSAMPLVWAHAEYIKLVRSLKDGKVFDMPAQAFERYVKQRVSSDLAIWRFNHKCKSIPPEKTLRIEVLSPATIHWSSDGWQNVEEAFTKDNDIGLHIADLPTKGLKTGSAVKFTFYWKEAGRWEGADFNVQIS